METTTLGPVHRQPAVPRHDADGRQDAGGRGPPHARPLPRGGRRPSSTRPTCTSTAARRRCSRPWLARHRDEVVLATKVRFPVSDPGGQGLAPDRIVKACDASLRRMGVDVIDLYQIHAPDPDVPLEATLEALDGLVRAGQGAGARRLQLPRLAARLGGGDPGPRGLGAVRVAAAAVLARGALDRGGDPALLPCGGHRRDPVGAARRRLPHAASTSAASARRRARASPTPTRRSRRPTSAGRSSATSRSSTPPARSPRSAARRSRRSRSPGCSAPRA